jgi:hypothetical protein
VWKNQDSKNECEGAAEKSKVNMGSVEDGEICDINCAHWSVESSPLISVVRN